MTKLGARSMALKGRAQDPENKSVVQDAGCGGHPGLCDSTARETITSIEATGSSQCAFVR